MVIVEVVLSSRAKSGCELASVAESRNRPVHKLTRGSTQKLRRGIWQICVCISKPNRIEQDVIARGSVPATRTRLLLLPAVPPSSSHIIYISHLQLSPHNF